MKTKSGLGFAVPLFLFCLFVTPAPAADNTGFETWEKYSMSAGVFLSALDTTIRLGSQTTGVGIDVNLEEITGLDTTNRSFRGNLLGRFGGSRAHRVDFDYFYYNRSSSKKLLQDLEIGGVIIPVGDTIHSTFNMQIYKLNYSYSFLMDDRVNCSVGGGAYLMPIFTSLGNDAGRLEKADITAPLPALNLRFEFALTPKLFLRQGVEFFYLKYGEFSGGLLDFTLGADYKVTEHFGLGVAVDSFSLGLQADGEDYPAIDFVGNIRFNYTGLMLYGKYYF